MYCGQCGSYVEDGAQFCPCCGAIMDKPELDDSGEYTGRSVQRAEEKTHRKWPWVVAVIVVIFVVAALFFWFWMQNSSEEAAFVEGEDSYTALITSYLESASADDEEAVLDLFFPNSDAYYQNEDGSMTTLQILAQEDLWIAAYGSQVTAAELGNLQFADLEEEQAAAVAEAIALCAGLEEISELYTVDATITYDTGSTADMVFEIVQCEYGCYLVAIQ